MVGSDTAMGPFRRSQRGIISGVIIAGFLVIPAVSVQAGNHPASAAISAVACVENPVGTVSIDELQNPATDSDGTGVLDLVKTNADPRLGANQILLYSPSREICIDITTADNATVHYGNVLLQPRPEVFMNANENEGPFIDLLILPPVETLSPQTALIITVIPAGY
jgi:hypothetical protein